MTVLFSCVVIFLCFSLSSCGDDSYRAGVIRGLHSYGDLETYPGVPRRAADAKLDVLLLSPPEAYSSIKDNEESYGLENYDELVKLLSGVAQSAGCYLVAHLLDSTKCQSRRELVRTNVVFNRRGEMVTEYRKPVNPQANCTSLSANIASFDTDFGVTVGVMMEEDFVLLERDDLKALQNFVVSGGLSSKIPFLLASKFSSTWAFVNNANVVSSAPFFGAQNVRVVGNLVFADFKKRIFEDRTRVPPVQVDSTASPEDLSMYVVKLLDLKTSDKGYRETVCHDQFCCEFYVKTKSEGQQALTLNYYLSAFNGVREYSIRQDIGAEICAVLSCAGVHKRSCQTGLNSNNTITFEKVSVSGNFTGSTQYPIAIVTDTPGRIELRSETIGKMNRVTLKADSIKLSSFGVFVGDHSRDTVRYANDVSDNGYMFNDQMQEIFDYVWIRLRVLIFVVSIYVLEMM